MREDEAGLFEPLLATSYMITLVNSTFVAYKVALSIRLWLQFVDSGSLKEIFSLR